TSYPSRTCGATLCHASLRRRRARFRWTAPPSPRPVTNPIRMPCSRGTTYSTIRLPTTCRPPLTTRLNSDERRSEVGPTGVKPKPSGRSDQHATREWEPWPVWSDDSRRELRSPLATAPRQHCAARARAHAEPEAVGLLSLPIVRLIGLFHSRCTPRQ